MSTNTEKFNRQQAIDELVEQDMNMYEDSVDAIQGNLLDVIEDIRRNGHKGFEQYSDKELQQELQERVEE
tara:strand:- start:1097 stop:1306 length:210 start_codon:yes stop_codon:yes gene_type:complete